MDLQDNPPNEVLSVNFNQDYTSFVCGTKTGFCVYSTDPFRLTHRRDFEDGVGLGVAAMLFRTNLLVFSGGEKNPRFQPHKAVLWDDRQARPVAELEFKSPVKSIRVRRDLVVVVLESKVYVYGFRTLRLFDSIETISNPKGLCCLSIGTDRVVLVCPGMLKGRILCVYYPADFGESQTPVARERTMTIGAHQTSLAAMAITYGGSLLATASETGTIVRVYDTNTGAKLQELRRGADKAEVHSLAFSPTGEWLVVASDRGTVHVFVVCRNPGSSCGGSMVLGSSTGAAGIPAAIPGGGYPSAARNSKSSLQRLAGMLPAYFNSEWSFARFRVPDYRCIAAFGAEPTTIVVVCANGVYYKARFDLPQGGEMVELEKIRFDEALEKFNAATGANSARTGAASQAEESAEQPAANAADVGAISDPGVDTAAG
eukprot:TRINITY_DN28976_c0_g1_i1.p1 TRINITY_DN28976_c0_g1~~TRINITY_DN28976_c0_g1_i1.p1  ORF type:complete len:429 (-),score=44.55 TRINITY_DN28976_c0_g1_i1:268-1554(-)